MKSIRFIGGAAIVLVATTVLAHHGWSGYETSVTKLSGTVERSNYGNPHGTMVLKAADKSWNVVLAPVSRMETRGLTREMLASGAPASVEGYIHMQTKDELRAERITIGGKTIELR
jgi:Family of unknown function (DUF6152)